MYDYGNGEMVILPEMYILLNIEDLLPRMCTFVVVILFQPSYFQYWLSNGTSLSRGH